MTITPKFLYFHGLNSNQESRKYQDIKEYFKNEYDVSCIEWKNEDDIQRLLDSVEEQIDREENPVLVGDSTGGNFAYQLKERRKKKGKKSTLVLLNPLLVFKLRTSSIEFPENIKSYLKNIAEPKDAFLLIGEHDETLDHSFLLNQELENAELHLVNDSHRLPEFKKTLPKIREYIQSKRA